MGHAGIFLLGLLLLVVGGRLLVSASVDAARRLRVSPLVVGLTLVAWGTSAPELALNAISAFKGRGDLVLGNVVGSNICNMALVLGIAALIKPLAVSERLIRVELWLNPLVLGFLFLATALVGPIGGDARWIPGVLLAFFAIYSGWTIVAALREASQVRAAERAQRELADTLETTAPMGWWLIAACFVGGLALLSYGGDLASDGAAGLATALGIPASIVAVTIVSIGTTLPELITSVLAIRKGHSDLAMGNALGSCLFNAGAVFGFAGLVAPPRSTHGLLVPLGYMALLAWGLVPISRTFGKTVSRLEGGLLLASYGIFLVVSAWSVL